ncbi:FecR domain-containing protein [Chitinophaga sp. GCM10012297]|uniref:FecR domain-containing protein n=1 Tax=Chitinophaga chungangae TaxID=2821488 RepID=A0ABS3YFB5_9BACT|nr:FecR domain-containing protein [Chitinophaga chungangae]MBO9153381.1 FecR domain-containing protein [Chitinophaga chungangae]
MLSNDHIDTLIAREIEGEISAEEMAQLQSWLEADPANQAYYEALKDTWDLTADAYAGMPEPDVERNWQRFSGNVAAPEPLRVVTRRNSWWRMAAAAVVIVAAAGLVFTLVQRGKETVLVADADKKTFTLPDGSRVYLNRNSQVSYNAGFGDDNRTVKLKGEAFFDVAADAANPFIVAAGASQTKVLGTSFVIKAYEHKPVQLDVVTGKVAFSGKKGEEGALVLTAGNSAILQQDKEPQQVKNGDPNFMAWKENRLYFHNMPLYKTLTAVENYFNVRFVVSDSSLLTLNYTGTFSDPSLAEVLDVISKAAGVTISEEEKDVYRISR